MDSGLQCLPPGTAGDILKTTAEIIFENLKQFLGQIEGKYSGIFVNFEVIN